jgi:hypothetical protein
MTTFEMKSQPTRLIRTPWSQGRRAGLIALACAVLLMSAGAASAQGYEVWVSDQANTQGISVGSPSGTHGGKVRIYDGADLEQTPPFDDPLVLDVTTDLFPTADVTTGTHVTRIHGITPSPDHRYMALNFVVSGHLGIVDGETKLPVCLFRSTGTSTGRQNHMSFWTPDGSHVMVANQNGRILERVDVARDVNGAVLGFAFNAAATLDLVGGVGRVLTPPVAVDMDADDDISCTVSGMVADGQPTTTPTGEDKQAAGIRPTNTVICPVPASNSQHVFATLGGGGLFVVDLRSTPMAIVAEYDLMRRCRGRGLHAPQYRHAEPERVGVHDLPLRAQLCVGAGLQSAQYPPAHRRVGGPGQRQGCGR